MMHGQRNIKLKKTSLIRARPLRHDGFPDMKPDLQPSNHDVQLICLIHFVTLPA